MTDSKRGTKRKSIDGMETQQKWKRIKRVKHSKNTKTEKQYLELHGQEMETHIKSIYPTAIVYNTRPLVVHIPNFLTVDECKEKLAEIAPTFDKKSVDSKTTSEDSSMGIVDTSVRKSKSVSRKWPRFGSKLENLFLNKEVPNLMGQLPIFIRYQHQGFTMSHWDYLPRALNPRRYTALLYLNDVPESNGGATVFDDIVDQKTNQPLKFQPKCGDLVFFRVSMSNPYQNRVEISDNNSVHQGCAFTATPDCPEKWVCQLFILDKINFREGYFNRLLSLVRKPRMRIDVL